MAPSMVCNVDENMDPALHPVFFDLGLARLIWIFPIGASAVGSYVSYLTAFVALDATSDLLGGLASSFDLLVDICFGGWICRC